MAIALSPGPEISWHQPILIDSKLVRAGFRASMPTFVMRCNAEVDKKGS